MGMKREDGFTLSELLIAVVVLSAVLALGASSFRRYWQTSALRGGVDAVVTELRAQQQKASSESHPWVWGAWFKEGTGRWGVVRGNSSDGTCEVKSRHTLSTRVTFGAVSFADVTTLSLSSNCSAAAEPGAEVVLFFPRGSATEGTVSVAHAEVGGGTPRTITVSPITGRVTSP